MANESVIRSGIYVLGNNSGIGGIDTTTRLYVRGSDTSSGTYSLKVDNSAFSPLLYVRNDGNVGIGTTSPTSKLDVNGQIVAGLGGGVITANDSPFYGVRANAGAPNYYTGYQFVFEVGGGVWGIGQNYALDQYQFLGSATTNFAFGSGTPTAPSIKFLMDMDVGYFGANTTSPTANIHAKGIDNTSSNYSLKIESASASSLFNVRNDGNIYYNTDLNLLRSVGGTNKILIGGGSVGGSSIAIGEVVNASGLYSVAIGSNTTANTESSVGIGYVCSSGYLGVAIGRVANSLDRAVAIGESVTAQVNSTAIGNSSFATQNSIAIGNGSALGASASARGTEYISLGYSTNSDGALAIGTRSVTIGGYSYTSGLASGSFGTYLKALASNSFVFGSGIQSPEAYLVNNIANSLMFGCNSNTPTLFVGGGNGASGSTGNVGIGLTVPTSKLHVIGSDNTSSNFGLKIESASASSLLSVRNDGFSTIHGLNIGRGSGGIITNSVLGFSALNNNISGAFNTAVGYISLESTTGERNSGFGYGSLSANTTGIRNTSVGMSAGNVNTIGDDNVFIGASSNPSVNNLTNSIAIGYNSVVSTSNTMVLGNGVNVCIGTTHSTAKLQVVGLLEYTDNATAVVGGLTAGAFYRTGDLLKVVH